MRNFYLGIKFSLSYFSIFPVSFSKNDDLSNPTILGSMLFFFPFVGLILGFMTVGIYLFFEHFGWYGAIISAVLYMMMYGFIHTEAIIDVVDAIYARHSGKDAYDVIKESTVGAMGVLYAVGFMLLKIAGIIYLLIHSMFSEFISILIISRLSLLMLIDTLEFRSSFVSQLKESLNWKVLISSFLLTLLVGSLLNPLFIIIMVFGFVLALSIAIILGKQLGFLNGDVLGATLEIVELILFMIIALF